MNDTNENIPLKLKLEQFLQFDCDGLSDYDDYFINSSLEDIRKKVSTTFNYKEFNDPLKKAKTIEEQIELLKERNLRFKDIDFAKKHL